MSILTYELFNCVNKLNNRETWVKYVINFLCRNDKAFKILNVEREKVAK